MNVSPDWPHADRVTAMRDTNDTDDVGNDADPMCKMSLHPPARGKTEVINEGQWLELSTNLGPTLLVAVAGGLARYMNDLLNGKSFSVSALGANLIISGFCGFMFVQFAANWQMGDRFQAIAAGMGGFMGVEGVRLLQIIILRRLSVKIDSPGPPSSAGPPPAASSGPPPTWVRPPHPPWT